MSVCVNCYPAAIGNKVGRCSELNLFSGRAAVASDSFEIAFNGRARERVFLLRPEGQACPSIRRRENPPDIDAFLQHRRSEFGMRTAGLKEHEIPLGGRISQFQTFKELVPFSPLPGDELAHNNDIL